MSARLGADRDLCTCEPVGLGAQVDVARLFIWSDDGEAATAEEAMSIAAVGLGVLWVVAAHSGEVARAGDRETGDMIGGRHWATLRINGFHGDVGEVVGVGGDGIAVGGEAKALGGPAGHK